MDLKFKVFLKMYNNFTMLFKIKNIKNLPYAKNIQTK